ncbi:MULTISPECIES: PucR family transcriptional regulator [unclassified Mycobacterium]|uniref:PucR family transcriptional regulator n=1 Tax=unclassified Mycobacterium TaxID=2642494 RepID=UPI00055A1F99|nr:MULTISPECIES: PucR family transcriptional regulator [unclassified Mycobacterium]SEB16797.1 PucR C-terminal helix-turn-helix domain-containing protein [Mycobacterium sp. 283mftsu]
MTDPAARFSGLDLDEEIVRALEGVLPQMAERTVAAVTAEVPSYTDAFSGPMGQTIENAVQLALGAFLRLTTRSHDTDPGPRLSPALDGAYDLGRGEARTGRSIDALLSAYRVGARVSWRELSATAVAAGLSAATTARFAEMVFAFIDELSAASVSGHADELAAAGRVRQRHLDRLAAELLAGAPMNQLLASAEQADWKPPKTLSAVLLPEVETRKLSVLFAQETLHTSLDVSEVDAGESLAVVLVPDADGQQRQRVLDAMTGSRVIVGPSRQWWQVKSSYLRAMRTRALVAGGSGVVDTEEHLVDLVLSADHDAADDLRRRVLAPLAGLRPSTAERLEETLRAWVLHLGRRDAVAESLFVHPQTVRYRMTQLRDFYGDRLDDPDAVLEITVALGLTGARTPGATTTLESSSGSAGGVG